MNERMIELMNEANKTAGFTFSMDQAKPVHDLMEKFAKLIVWECANIVEDSPWNLPQGYKSKDQAKLVKKHFGIK
jgi:hypothetical protein